MFSYNPANWYWIINGTTIYSSASASTVTATDATYVAWLAKGNKANPVDLAATLDAYLQLQGLPITGLTLPTKSQLISYANAKADTIISTMKAYGTAPSILKADRTSSTITDLIAIQQDAVTNPTDTVAWLANDNTVTTLTASEIAALAPTVAADRKAIYAIAGSAVLAINAGTITTKTEIDALAWPT